MKPVAIRPALISLSSLLSLLFSLSLIFTALPFKLLGAKYISKMFQSILFT